MRNMDKWLGTGGMELIGKLGASFETYGVNENNLGWVRGSWVPTELCLNPHKIAQAGVQAVLLDALMNFAVNTSLEGKDHTKATLEMKLELLRPATKGITYNLYGCISHITRQIAFGYAEISDDNANVISKSTGTFLLKRYGG